MINNHKKILRHFTSILKFYESALVKESRKVNKQQKKVLIHRNKTFQKS